MSSLFLHDHVTLAFWSPGPAEMMVLAVVALLLYGGNLPEVARSWGKSFSEFRRGLTGFQSELNNVIYSEPEKIAYQDENYRDDASYPDGYEESDPYQEGAGQEDTSQGNASQDADSENSQGSQGESDENEMTINDANADTIVFEGALENLEENSDENAEKESEEKPTD